MSESDVCRRQNMTYKNGPRSEGIKKNHNSPQTHNTGIQLKRKELTKLTYDDFKIEKTPFK